MQEKYIEKSFLNFLALSLLLHAAVITMYCLAPEKKRVLKPEPVFVDLMDTPSTVQSLPGKGESPQLPRAITEKTEKNQVQTRKEKVEDDLTYIPRLPLRGAPPSSERMTRELPRIKTGPRAIDTKKEAEPGEVVVKPGKKLPELSRLFPNSDQMKGLEERYRKELGVVMDGGFSDSLDSEDLILLSFLSRFMDSVNARFPHYSGEEMKRILTDTGGRVAWRVIVVFNRNGSVADIRYTSTGSKELDDTLERVLHSVGPVGVLPKRFEREELKVPFIYSLTRSGLTG